MNFSESCSSSSSKRQENGDMFSDTERPFKKARFSWQVKGKYHLKNRSNDDININNTTTASESSSIDTNNALNTPKATKDSESNIEILGDYLIKNDFNNTLDTVINDSEKSILKPCSEVNTVVFNPMCSEENRINLSKLSIPNLGIIVPGSSAARIDAAKKKLILTEDKCIKRWQQRQKARVFIDNTINRVLDVTSVPVEVGVGLRRYVMAQDLAEFVNNHPGTNTVEDKGIQMAISAHGLQNSLQKENEKNVDINTAESSSSSNNNMLKTEQNIDKQEINVSIPTPVLDEGKSKLGSVESLSIQQESSTSNEVLDDTCSSESLYPYCEIDENIITQPNNHDFMNEAVSFAIQNIGLTSSSTNCG